MSIPVRSRVQAGVLLRPGLATCCLLAILVLSSRRSILPHSSPLQAQPPKSALTAVIVTPSQVTLAPGGQAEFTAVGRYSDGSTRSVTVTWSATGGTIGATGPTGRYTAGTITGKFRVIAMAQGAALADTSSVAIEARGAPGAIVLSPGAATLEPGHTQQFTARGMAGHLASVTYTATGGTISSGGLYTAGSTLGSYRVIATELGGALTDTALVVIQPTTGIDRIQISGDVAVSSGGPTWPTVVLIDALVLPAGSAPGDLGQCQNDLLRGTDLTFANLKKSTCGFRDEIAVFSVDNAALLDSTAALVPGLWKDDQGEIHTEALGAPLSLPLKIWVAVGPTVVTDGIQADGTIGKVEQDALVVVDDDIATLATLYNLNRAGVVPAATKVPVWNNSAAVADIGKSCLSAAAKTSWYTPGALNVYYVAAVEKPAGGAYAGWYCGSLETLPAVRDPHVIYISFPQRNFTMLSHEVGHALGLLHTGAGTTAQTFDPASATPKPFTNANLMWDMFAAPRSTFALGQAFRMNFDVRSVLFSLALRTPPGRQCECTLMTGACTYVEFYRKSDLAGQACPRISLSAP